MTLVAKIEKSKIISIQTLKTIKRINLHRKIHFLVFNLVVIDIAFTGTRTLLHMKITRVLAYHLILGFLTFSLAILDTLEIFVVTINIIYREDRKRKREELKK
jgi:hypothetical protein